MPNDSESRYLMSCSSLQCFNHVHSHGSRVKLFMYSTGSVLWHDQMLLVCFAAKSAQFKSILVAESQVSLHVVLVSQICAVRVAVAWTHGDALFLTQRLDDSCSRRLEHLPRKSHSAVCWVPSKVLDLLAEVQSQAMSPECKHKKLLLTKQCLVTDSYLYLLSHL